MKNVSSIGQLRRVKAHRWAGYVLAAVLSVITLALRLALGYDTGDPPMLVLFVLSTTVSAYVGGIGPGLFCTLLSGLLASYYLLPPQYAFSLTNSDEAINLATMLVAGVVISFLVEALHRAREKAEASQEKFQLVADNASDWVFWLDPQGRSLYQSPSCLRITGYGVEEFEKDPGLLESIIHPDDLAKFQNHHREVSGKCIAGEVLFRIIRKDQELRWISHFCRPIFDSKGMYLGSRGTNHDATEQQKAQDSLRLKEAELKEAQRISHVGSWYWETNTGRVTGSDEFFSIYGLDPARPFPTFQEQRGGLYTVESWERKNEAVQEALKSGKGYTLDLEATRGDGGRIWVTTRGEAVRDARGRIVGLRGTIEDITVRKQSEDALRRAKVEWEQTFATVPDPIIVVDTEYRVVRVNQAMAQRIGRTPDECIGLQCHNALHGADARPPYCPHAKTLKDGLPHSAEVFDETLGAHFLISTNPLLDENGRIKGAVHMSRDITEYKTLQAELIAARDAAEKANRAKSEFLASMSHEIRTPMNGVLGLTDLLLRESGMPLRANGYLKMIKQSGLNLLAIINDILDLSKIEAGKAALERKGFQLRELLASVLVPLEPAARKKQLQLIHWVYENVPDDLVGDPGRLFQVLNNLLGNAVKFTQSGTVALFVKVSDGENAPDGNIRLQFSVKDTGIGIPPDQLESVFESFSQAHASAHPEFGGTGLGLAISKELVEMMAGRIWAESEEGKGSIFHFTAEFLRGTPAEATVEKATTILTNFVALKILLAEDNLINRTMTAELLKEKGHSVHFASNGQEALEALQREDFDLIIMDMQMPVLDGEGATQRIRAGEAGENRKDIPIVALSAYALKGDREKFLASGLNEYLTKPIVIEELEAVLDRISRKAS